uniref:L4-33K/L4-22K protein n=1 Tax=Pipistrellus pipistrellus adenovirus TaxID=3140007 RepID=A0AAU6S542_9ADEN
MENLTEMMLEAEELEAVSEGELSTGEEVDTEEEEPDEGPEEEEDLDGEDAAPAAPRRPLGAKGNRWDKLPTAKTDHSGKDTGRNGYRSWRGHKFSILEVLEQSNGNVAFARRYMLFKKGVNVPKNVIHYYNSRYCRPSNADGGWEKVEKEDNKENIPPQKNRGLKKGRRSRV